MQALENDWDSYDATIYTDGAATHSNANGSGSIIVTTGRISDHRVHRQCTITASTWLSSFQAEEKAVRTALKQVQEDVSIHKVRFVSDSMWTLQQMQNMHPSQRVANSDDNKKIDALASLLRYGRDPYIPKWAVRNRGNQKVVRWLIIHLINNHTSDY